jgi:hypothetical protein
METRARALCAPNKLREAREDDDICIGKVGAQARSAGS